jgi:hypothetical protein
MMYASSAADEPISPGDILDACPIFGLEVPASGVDLDAAPARWRERVIVVTQACDLAQTKTTKVLVALLSSAQFLVEKGVLKGPTVRDHAPIQLPESIIDLHDLHTIPRAVLERLSADGKRVCRLQPPYREHLAQHFAVTYMRIGLPTPYETEP